MQTRVKKHKPDTVDVCIVGAGAAGGTAAKVLAEGGMKVVCLERGPWVKPDEFSADELANFNRYLIWPDPKLHPRTYRSTPDAQAEIKDFCPVPSMVGGGTVHWSAWVPRMTLSDFRQHSLHGDVEGASLADWPIDYENLEPYYDKVEWTLGVAGVAGANRYEAPRRRGYPMKPLPRSRYGKLFRETCNRLGINTFPMPQAICSRPFRGRPASMITGYDQQYGDPTGARASTLTTYVPDALSTGNFELRPDCYAREVLVDRCGRAKGVLYMDADGDEVVQEAEAVILACGAMESARLMLLSTSNLFPDGIANGSGLVGRNLTLHEYTFAIGLFDREDEPIYGWAGAYEGGGSAEFYESDESRGHILGCLISATGLGQPINFTYPGRPMWGQQAKEADRDYFNHSMKVGVLVQDLPQESNGVDLDENVKDAWGVPALRVTHRAHPNDIALARWTVDRATEILEAANASKVFPVYVDRISGNCAHQHGTARMGVDPGRSVLNRWCRTHEVPNLYVFDGSPFPTSTGANPTLTIMANAWRCAERILATRGA